MEVAEGAEGSPLDVVFRLVKEVVPSVEVEYPHGDSNECEREEDGPTVVVGGKGLTSFSSPVVRPSRVE